MVTTGQQQRGSVAHIIYKGQPYDLEELSHLSQESLLEIQSEIDTEIVRIELQLEQDPKSQHDCPGWVAKAAARIRWRKRDRHMVARALQIRKSRGKEAHQKAHQKAHLQPLTPEMHLVRQSALKQSAFERRFMDSAKVLLTEETFRRILALAKQEQVET